MIKTKIPYQLVGKSKPRDKKTARFALPDKTRNPQTVPSTHCRPKLMPMNVEISRKRPVNKAVVNCGSLRKK